MQKSVVCAPPSPTACIQPDTFETTFLDSNYSISLLNLFLVSIVRMLFELEWFKQLLNNVFMHKACYLISNCCSSTLVKKWLTGLVDQMTATVFRQTYMTQRPSLFTPISYAVVFSFALIFANGWCTACDGFYGASAYWLSHMKQ